MSDYNSTWTRAKLREVLKHYGLSAYQLAKELNINQQNISHFLTGRNQTLKSDFLTLLLMRYPDIDCDYLLTGKGGGTLIKSDTKSIDYYKNQVVQQAKQIKKQNRIIEELLVSLDRSKSDKK